MNSVEIKHELSMSYQELVNYLLKKYGSAEYDYFCNEKLKSRNPKVSRSKEGLICHHIDEDKTINLGEPLYARLAPYEYQKANRLVYCNVFEHLILHMKITFEPRNPDALYWLTLGVGGIINSTIGINDYYDGYEYKREYQKKLYEIIADNFDDYIEILKYLLKGVEKWRPDQALLLSKENLSRGFKKNIVKKVYNKL